MKKGVLVLLVLICLAAAPVSSEGLGLTVGVETGTGDLLGEEDYSQYLMPFVDVEIGDTGLLLGAWWEIPIIPDPVLGTLGAYLEFGFSALGLDFALGNELSYAFEPGADPWSSYLYGIVGYSFPFGLTFQAELDFSYLPDILLDGIVTAFYELALGPGTFGLEAALNLALYTEPALGDTDFAITYALPLGSAELLLGVNPTLTTSTPENVGLTLSALVSLSFSL